MGIKRLQRLLIFGTILLSNFVAQAKGNYVDSKPYFVGREDELLQINKQLRKEGVSIIFGKSGTGKTQLIRQYIKRYKRDYDYIWVIDCLGNINRQFEEFIKFVSFDASDRGINNKNSLYKYFKLKKLKVLICYDNIQTSQNRQVGEVLEEATARSISNIKYIFATQQKFDHSHIEVGNLKKEEIFKLLSLTAKRHIDINKIFELTKGHPLLTYKFIEALNNNRFLTEEEVYKHFHKNLPQSFILYVQRLKALLTKSGYRCLHRLSLVNNSSMDKNEIVFLCGQNNGIKNLIEIQKFNILEEKIDSNKEFRGFEMHNMIKDKVIEISDKKATKSQILDLIKKVNALFVQDDDHLDVLLVRYPNLLAHVEEIRSRAKKFNIPLIEQLELTTNMVMLYLYYGEYALAREQIDWIRSHYKESDIDKNFLHILAYSYACEGMLEDFQTGNAKSAIKNFKKALKLYSEAINVPIEGLYMTETQLAQTYVYINEFDEARSLLANSEKMLQTHQKIALDPGIYYFLLSKIQYEEGDYHSALDTINVGIKLLEDKPDNHFKAPFFTLKSDILIELGENDEALSNALKALKDTKKTLQIEGEMLARARLSYANCLVEVGDNLGEAAQQIQKARIGLEKDRGKGDPKKSDDDDLAFSYLIESKIYKNQSKYKEALDSIINAINIYENRYGRKISSAKMKRVYEFASRMAERVGDEFLYKLYQKKNARNFGN